MKTDVALFVFKVFLQSHKMNDPKVLCVITLHLQQNQQGLQRPPFVKKYNDYYEKRNYHQVWSLT